MPLHYPRYLVLFNRLFEGFAFVLVWPWLRALRRRGGPPDKWIVLVEPFGMGDALSLSVTLDLLRQHLTEHKICLWLKQENAELYAGDERVARVETAPFPWSRLSRRKAGTWRDWWAVWASARRVRALRPELGFDTRSEIRSQLLLVLAGCRRRVGYRSYLNTNLNVRGLLLTQILEQSAVPRGSLHSPAKRATPVAASALHRYDRNLALIAGFLQVAPPSLVLPTFGRAHAPVTGPCGLKETRHQHSLVVHPGARWEYNRWPRERWAELVTGLSRLPGVSVELIGAPADAKLLTEICAGVSVPINCRTTPLPALPEAIANACLVICMDSGPMHMADTMGTPVLALFGPGDVDLWHPRGPQDRWLHVRYACNPCLQKTCIHPADPCIRAISVEDVMRAVCAVLGTTAAAQRRA